MIRTDKIRAMVYKELKQLQRDRLTAAMVFGIPVMQLLLFGFAINYNVRNIPAAWCDQAESVKSRQIIQDIQAGQVLDLQIQTRTPEELRQLIQSGKVRAGVLIPQDLSSRLQDNRSSFQILTDGSSSVVTGAVTSLASLPLYQGEHSIDYRNQEALPIQVLPLYNPEQRTAVEVIPGLIGIILTMTLMLFTAIALVRETEHGSMEMLITTPVSPMEIIIGKLLPYIGIGIFQTILVFLLGILVFRLPVNGRITDIALAVLMFISSTLSMGLLISSFVKTQFQAVQVSIFILLPSILLSGFVFPYEGMPAFARGLSKILPVTHFIELMRGIVLRGAGIAEMPLQIGVLLLFIVITMSLAWLRMRNKQLD
ncbi:MAG: ABC transporter permease [Spirochaetales bacterium]|nr:ABC transporter permease [Spirochaetales bacterium]